MMNWIQEITPQIKDKNGDLTARMDACLPHFLEAANSGGQRNLAGEMFKSINEFKYAKPFMASLAQHMMRELPLREASKILAFHPELMSMPTDENTADSKPAAPKKRM